MLFQTCMLLFLSMEQNYLIFFILKNLNTKTLSAKKIDNKTILNGKQLS